jgi:hypothetical protein
MMRTTNLLLILLGLVVAPLSAQDLPRRIEIAPAEVTNIINGDTTVVNVVGCDDACVAREEAAVRAEERIADAIEAWVENCGCVDQGTSNVVRIGQGALVVAAFLIAFQLKGIKDGLSDVNGQDGENGQDGHDGQDGQDGVDGQDADSHTHDDDNDSSEGHGER